MRTSRYKSGLGFKLRLIDLHLNLHLEPALLRLIPDADELVPKAG